MRTKQRLYVYSVFIGSFTFDRNNRYTKYKYKYNGYQGESLENYQKTYFILIIEHSTWEEKREETKRDYRYQLPL